MKFFSILGLFFCLSLFSNTANALSSKSPLPDQEVNAILFRDPDLSIFANAVIAADIRDLFIGTGPWTGFIPVNKAFEKYGIERWNEYLTPQNKDKLIDILTYHVVSGKYLSSRMKSERVKSVEGKFLNISVNDGKIKVNNARVIQKDMIGPNGVLFKIDALLMP
jgi:uncharacterized surface protein with fasciclin (FAS1) repeats